MTKKTLSVVNSVNFTQHAPTYRELMQKHLDELTDERANLTPSCLIMCAEIPEGTMHQILHGESITGVIGTLEMTKSYICLEGVMGEE